MIYVHGWRPSHGNENSVLDLATAYFENKNVNFIIVNWKDLAFANYLKATLSVKEVGVLTGQLIFKISRHFKDPQLKKQYFDTLHIIGHSLGAHIGGMASKELQEKFFILIGRITGLEAAGPLFSFPLLRTCKHRLCKKDAQFVDLIHTNIFVAGTALPLGHADFYVNLGGPVQPACVINFVSQFLGSISPCKYLVA